MHWIWDSLFLRRKLGFLKLDFFHATDQLSAPIGMQQTKVLMHLHDVIPFLFWRQYAAGCPYDFRVGLKLSLKKAARVDAIITDSECSRKDIVEWTGADPSRIHVVPFGCDDQFRPVEPTGEREAFLRSKQIKSPYILYVGGTDHRKNLPFLVRVFEQLRDSGYPGFLYLVGEEFGWTHLAQVQKIHEEIGRSRHSAAIRMPGYVNSEELRMYLACADAFVFPSLYEGFGLPALEAMSCGVPVVVSNRSSIPEVVGDAGLYFDPSSQDECVKQLIAVTTDEDLRQELRHRGLQRAKLFSWRRAVEQIFQIYQGLESK